MRPPPHAERTAELYIERDQLREERDQARAERDTIEGGYKLYLKSVLSGGERDAERISALEEALRHYAERNNWDCRRCGGSDDLNCGMLFWKGPIGTEDDSDYGHGWSIARAALSSTTQSEPEQKPGSPLHPNPSVEAAEQALISRGLQDIEAGRVKPLDQIRRELVPTRDATLAEIMAGSVNLIPGSPLHLHPSDEGEANRERWRHHWHNPLTGERGYSAPMDKSTVLAWCARIEKKYPNLEHRMEAVGGTSTADSSNPKDGAEETKGLPGESK